MSHASETTEMCMLSQKPVLAVSGTKVLNLILNLRTSLNTGISKKDLICVLISVSRSPNSQYESREQKRFANLEHPQNK